MRNCRTELNVELLEFYDFVIRKNQSVKSVHLWQSWEPRDVVAPQIEHLKFRKVKIYVDYEALSCFDDFEILKVREDVNRDNKVVAYIYFLESYPLRTYALHEI